MIPTRGLDRSWVPRSQDIHVKCGSSGRGISQHSSADSRRRAGLLNRAGHHRWNTLGQRRLDILAAGKVGPKGWEQILKAMSF